MALTTPTFKIPYAVAADNPALYPTQVDAPAAKLLDTILTNLSAGRKYINGRWYEGTGKVTFTPTTLTNHSNAGQLYYTTVNINHPFTPPAGYHFIYHVASSGDRFSTVSTFSTFSTYTSVRYIQFANATRSQIELIWTLEKE